MKWPARVALLLVLLTTEALAQSANPNQTCTSFSGTIAGNISGATFDLTIDDIAADDITCDQITCASFISSCTGAGCYPRSPVIVGTPDAADADTLGWANDDDYPAVVQPSSGGSTAFTAGAANTVVTGSGNAAWGPLLWAISSGDGACAAAGTVDATPDCAQEVCTNYGQTCQDATVVTLGDSTCTALHLVTVQFFAHCK